MTFHHACGGLGRVSRLNTIVGQHDESAWIGVDLRFILSGFLSTGVIVHFRDPPYHFRNFIARRALPILPLCFVLVLFVIAPPGPRER